MLTVDERTASSYTVIRSAMDSVRSSIRVAMPGIVEKYDAKTQTVSVQLAIREKVHTTGADNQQTVSDVNIPLLVDVPIVMPRAGGFVLAFVPKKGDECLVIFADLCIDGWWQSGGVQNQAELRRHDLSDGFAIFGTWSQKRLVDMPSSGVSLQDENGSNGIHITGSRVNLFGNVTVNGNPWNGGS